MRAGVAGALVEADAGDEAVDVGAERTPSSTDRCRPPYATVGMAVGQPVHGQFGPPLDASW